MRSHGSAAWFVLAPWLVLALEVAATANASGQVTWRESLPTPRGSGGTGSRMEANDVSVAATISADGRFVAFSSLASNLVAADTNGTDDVFVRDRQTATTTRVSVNSTGAQGDLGSYGPSISSDGRFVAFYSYAANLVAGDGNGAADVFVHDRLTARTTRVSVDAAGAEGNDDSSAPSLSADGRFVAFASFASNLVSGDTNKKSDVFVRDRLMARTFRVSVNSAGGDGDSESSGPSMSANGWFVAFQSRATNLVAADTNGKFDVFVRDLQTATTSRVSVDSAGAQGRSHSFTPKISADGNIVAFTSQARNLVAGDTNYSIDVFVRDRQAATTTRVSVDSAGVEGNDDSDGVPSISGDGKLVAFRSAATNLVPGDANGSIDVFVHDRSTSITTPVSVDSAGLQGDGGCDYFPSIAADGRFFAFSSRATNLVSDDTNWTWDVFVHGPYLTLSAASEVVAAGDLLELTTWTGRPGSLVLMHLVEVNGVPVSGPNSSGRFDPLGRWTAGWTVPPGLSGSVMTFRAMGATPIGTVELTNRETVKFQ